MRFSKRGKPQNKRYTQIVDDLGNDRGSNIKPDMHQEVQDGINVMARKNMYKSSYAIKVDPYNELNQASTVYDFITKPNSTYSPSYLGETNLDGGYTSQYLTSTSSKLLDVVDTMIAQISINYRFLNLDNRYESVINNVTRYNRGDMLLRKMYDAINETLSQLDATTFTYLSMNTNYAVMTSLTIPDVEPDYTFDQTDIEYPNGENTGHRLIKVNVYTDPAAVILVTSLAYQIPLMNAILGFNYVNKAKFHEAEMLHMNYDRETDPLNSFFGQLMKSTFTTKLNSIILALKGEYVDVDFIKTLNMITQVNSRDANDMIDPVTEIVGQIIEPEFTAVFSEREALIQEISTDPYTETNAMNCFAKVRSTASCIWFQTQHATVINQGNTYICSDTFTTNLGTYKLRSYASIIGYDYSMTGLLAWARRYNGVPLSNIAADLSNVTAYEVTGSVITSAQLDATKLYNRLEQCVTGIAGVLNKFKTAFPDLRTVYDKLTPIGVVNWTKGVELQISTKFDNSISHFIIIDDIYKSVLSGPSIVTFSPTTGRWSANTFWDKYEGIPEYDKMSGGQFITLSGRTLDCAGSYDTNIEFMPRLYNFTHEDYDTTRYVFGVSRRGDIVKIDFTQGTSVTSNPTLRRLAILPHQQTDTIRIPYIYTIVNMNSTTLGRGEIVASWLEMNLSRVFGTFRKQDESITLKTSLIAFYSYEILNESSNMIAYAKAAGVFRGTTDREPAIGFKGLTRQ